MGDFIDRGPKIRETLQIVRAMVSRDAAEAVIGNHEFNALCFHTERWQGRLSATAFRQKQHQHSETLAAGGGFGGVAELLTWFKDLPIFLELDGLRVVHAAWDEAAIQAVRGRSFHDAKFLSDAGTKGTPEAVAIEILLKGHEIPLPEGEICRDKDGTERSEMRVRWWRSQSEAHTYLAVAVPGAVRFRICPCPNRRCRRCHVIAKSDPPVVFGHYWLPADAPRPLSDNAACVDFSVAKQADFSRHTRGAAKSG